MKLLFSFFQICLITLVKWIPVKRPRNCQKCFESFSGLFQHDEIACLYGKQWCWFGKKSLVGVYGLFIAFSNWYRAILWRVIDRLTSKARSMSSVHHSPWKLLIVTFTAQEDFSAANRVMIMNSAHWLVPPHINVLVRSIRMSQTYWADEIVNLSLPMFLIHMAFSFRADWDFFWWEYSRGIERPKPSLWSEAESFFWRKRRSLLVPA